MIALTGLDSVSRKRASGFSLGMGQRLEIAATLLGRGRIIADAPVSEILALATGTAVLVRTPDAERFGALLAAPNITIAHGEPHLWPSPSSNGQTRQRCLTRATGCSQPPSPSASWLSLFSGPRSSRANTALG